ncbi:MAG: SDR family NAD(P)-dependent oxidoreductase [Acidimicrobiia bacterium]
MTENQGRLAGKVALITGAARGLGAQMARRFREEGATPVVTDLSEAAARAVADEVSGDAYALDVTDSAAVAEVFAKVAADHGRLDVLVNNAGISGMEDRPDEVQRNYDITMAQMTDTMSGNPPSVHLDVTERTTDDDWHRVLAVHLDGTFFCTREAVRIMGPGGAIINLGSIMGTSGGAGAPAYCAAKSGILGLTRAHAREFVTRDIRVNAIAPGWIETSMTDDLGPMKPLIVAQTPMGRMGDVDDIAWAAVYLASDEAKFVTGQVLSPNGGWYMSQ